MKLYIPEDKKVVRVDIKGGKNNSTAFTLIDTTIEDTIIYVKKTLRHTVYNLVLSCLEKPPSVTVSCYYAKGNQKFKSKSITVYGLDAMKIREILINGLK